MKLFADKTAQHINHWRETILKNRKTKQLATITASAVLLGGFFYCLSEVAFLKTTLGYANNQKLLTANQRISERLTDLLSPVARSFAMENRSEPDFSQTISGLVCNDQQDQLELDQDIESIKKEYICKGMYLASEPLKESGSKTDDATSLLKGQLERIVKNTPMEEMLDPLSQQDQTVAAFLVGIALKESSMGLHSPRKAGRSCYNFWGIKGSINPTEGGYNCFASPTQAVEITGKRLAQYVEKNMNTPAKLVTRWKCGSTCAGHSPESVASWVRDVSKYFHQINKS